MKVSVAVLPGMGTRDVAVGASATVADALNAAGQSSEGFTVTVEGIQADLSTVIREGQRILLTKNTKGN